MLWSGTNVHNLRPGLVMGGSNNNSVRASMIINGGYFPISSDDQFMFPMETPKPSYVGTKVVLQAINRLASF